MRHRIQTTTPRQSGVRLYVSTMYRWYKGLRVWILGVDSQRGGTHVMTLTEVVGRFLSKKRGAGGSLTSDGQRLLSYGTVIGQWVGTSVVLPNAGTYYSRTTSRHRNMLRGLAAPQGIETLNR